LIFIEMLSFLLLHFHTVQTMHLSFQFLCFCATRKGDTFSEARRLRPCWRVSYDAIQAEYISVCLPQNTEWLFYQSLKKK